MSAAQRRRVVNEVLKSWPVDAPPTRLVDVLASVAVEKLGLHSDLAAEFAEEHLLVATEEIRESLFRADARGELSRVAFNSSSSSELIQGSSFRQLNWSETEDEAGARRRRAHLDSYAAFLRSLSWRELEICCRGILEVLGCEAPSVTSSSNDQGVDFVGILGLRGRLGNASILPSVDSKLSVWILGQAKHYPDGQVSTASVRELVGSVELLRAGVSSHVGGAKVSAAVRRFDPVLCLFMTTGTLSKAAERLLDATGVIAMDGMQMAAFLADNGIGFAEGAFDEHTLKSWLASHAPDSSPATQPID